MTTEHELELRRIERRGADDQWTVVRMRDLHKGDVFRMFEPDGTPVTWECALAGGTEFVADGDAYEQAWKGNSSDMRWTVASSCVPGSPCRC